MHTEWMAAGLPRWEKEVGELSLAGGWLYGQSIRGSDIKLHANQHVKQEERKAFLSDP